MDQEERMAAKANPSEESYAKACEIVSGWVASLHTTTRAAIGEDDGGQLIDTLAWALDRTDELAALRALVEPVRALLKKADREAAREPSHWRDWACAACGPVERALPEPEPFTCARHALPALLQALAPADGPREVR